MGSQLHLEAAHTHPGFDNYPYPLIHAAAAPTYTYALDARPPKRIRLETQQLTSIYPAQCPGPSWSAGTSALSPSHYHVFPQHIPPRSASVPPEQAKRGRKKKSSVPHHSDPFILEHMPFPEHQPWLKVKPRQRKAAVQVVEEDLVAPPESEAPNEGEALVLDKHADRIAALIAQKRRENDSKQFRQRMALQQRLHRGEKDELDRIIAASHDELKRKMELSAQGIFEESPPNGTELEFRTAKKQPALSPDESDDPEETVSSSSTHADRRLSHHRHSLQEHDHPSETRSIYMSENSELDEDLDELEPFHRAGAQFNSPEPILNPYAHTNQSTYYQRTISATQTLGVSNPAPRAAGNIYAPTMASQYSDSPRPWSSSQPWTRQMFHALPPTQTPEPERGEMEWARTRVGSHDSVLHDNAMRNIYLHARDNADFFGSVATTTTTTNSSSSSTPATGIAHMNHPNTIASPFTPSIEPEDPLSSSVLRSNMNMFTRQARENGVIGGNNNINISQAPRRNMFDKRN